MPHLDHDLLFALFLTVLNVIAIGGATAFLLFPDLADRMMPRSGETEGTDALDASGIGRKSAAPPSRKPAGPISWDLTTFPKAGTSRRG